MTVIIIVPVLVDVTVVADAAAQVVGLLTSVAEPLAADADVPTGIVTVKSPSVVIVTVFEPTTSLTGEPVHTPSVPFAHIPCPTIP